MIPFHLVFLFLLSPPTPLSSRFSFFSVLKFSSMPPPADERTQCEFFSPRSAAYVSFPYASLFLQSSSVVANVSAFRPFVYFPPPIEFENDLFSPLVRRSPRAKSSWFPYSSDSFFRSVSIVALSFRTGQSIRTFDVYVLACSPPDLPAERVSSPLFSKLFPRQGLPLGISESDEVLLIVSSPVRLMSYRRVCLLVRL